MVIWGQLRVGLSVEGDQGRPRETKGDQGRPRETRRLGPGDQETRRRGDQKGALGPELFDHLKQFD